MIEIKVPEFGESIQEVQVAAWLKQPGDNIKKNEELVELESEKASQSLEAEFDGVLQEIRVAAGEFAQVGDVLCVLSESGSAESAPAAETSAAAAAGSTPTAVASPPATETAVVEVADAQSDDGEEDHDGPIMPAAERVLSEYKISAAAITPTGPGGRLLKEDVLNYVRIHGLKPASDSSPQTQAGRIVDAPAAPAAPAVDSFATSTPVPSGPTTSPAPTSIPAEAPKADSGQSVPAAKPAASGGSSPAKPNTDAGKREEKTVPMSMIRRTIANRLVEAQQTAALLTTFNEIDMQPVKELRSKYKDAFQKKHGVKLGFMSFFAKAAVEGLRRYPLINGEIQGNQIVMKNYHDIGIAIGGGKGLVVPVLRSVERMSFADVERQIGHFADLAQDNKIVPEDLKGGTFTISNGGVYGSLLSTPIVNPPQSGILGLHSIQDRPIALNGQVVIRPMMYVALTYDHRIVDGKEAVGFLKTIKEVLEEPARLFLEV